MHRAGLWKECTIVNFLLSCFRKCWMHLNAHCVGLDIFNFVVIYLYYIDVGLFGSVLVYNSHNHVLVVEQHGGVFVDYLVRMI